MKKFNLGAYMFGAYTLFNDQHIEKKDGTKIVADAKGFVTLAASDAVTIGKKDYKKGENVKLKISDVMGWVEDNEWEDVVADAKNEGGDKKEQTVEEKAKSDEIKKNKTEYKALAKKVEEASSALVDAVMKGNVDTKPFTTAVQTAQTNLSNFEVLHPEVTEKAKVAKAAKEPKQERVYTEEEQKTITAYEEAKKAYDSTLEVLNKQRESVKTAREALPNDYKIKGNASTGVGGGPKPPKLTTEIMAEMYKAFKGEPYSVQGVSHPAKEGGIKNAEVARMFGYSGAYTNLVIKGEGKELYKYPKKEKTA